MDAITQAIINGSPNISVTLKASDLKNIFSQMLADVRRSAMKEAESEREKATMTRAEVMKLLGVSGTTLCRWRDSKYLVPVKVGAKSFYKASDINRLLGQKKA